MKIILAGILTVLLGLLDITALPQDIVVPHFWDVIRNAPASRTVPLTRGETITLRPHFMDDDHVPVNLTGAQVILQRSYAGSNDLTVTGSVLDATNGTAEVVIDTTAGYPASQYTWEIQVSGITATMIRAFGTLLIRDSVTFGASPVVLAAGVSDPISVPITRRVNRQAPWVPWLIPAKRGETLSITPQYVDDDIAVDLTHAYTAYFRYRPISGTNSYAIPAEFSVRTNGMVTAIWAPGNDLGFNQYSWDMIVSGSTSSMIRAGGTITLSDSIGHTATTGTPTVLNILDMATVQILNVGYAPWLSSYEIDDVRRYIEGLEDGSASLSVSSLAVAGEDLTPVVGGSLTGLTVTGYGTLTRTGPHTATINVTGDGGGTGGGGIGSYTDTEINGVSHTNSVRIADGDSVRWSLGTDGVWRASATTPNTWAVTGAVSWVVDGVEIGRVDANGITMLKGSLQLYEDDLNCNVRIYDGSRTAPSLTPYGHTNTIGMYVRGIAGSWGYGFSHAGSDILMIHAGGLSLLSTNALISGRFSGDLSGCSNYVETAFESWRTNQVFSGMTITNAGNIAIKDQYGIYECFKVTGSNGTIQVRDSGGTLRFEVNGSDGATKIRSQDTDERYHLKSWSYPSGNVTNLMPGNKTNVTRYYLGIVTNITFL